MMKKLTIITFFMSAILAGTNVHADYFCADIKDGDGVIVQANCADVAKGLSDSKQFPDVNFFGPQSTLLGLCYVSAPEGVRATINNREVIVESANAFTTNLIPIQLGGNESLASVIGKWTITDAQTGRRYGSAYTVDTIDLATGTEQDVVIGGSGKYLNAKGNVKIKSIPISNLEVQITEISGKICVPSDH